MDDQTQITAPKRAISVPLMRINMRNKELLNDLIALIRHLAGTPITDFGASPKVVPQGRKLRMLRRKQKTALLMNAVRRHIADKKEVSRQL